MLTSKRLIFLAAMALILWGCGLPGAATPVDEPTIIVPASGKFSLVRLTPSDKPLEELLSAEAEKAQESGQAPFVEFDADWCVHCQALNESLGDERMSDAFEGTYIIQLDLDEWESELPDAGFYVAGIPAFYEIDEDGSPTERTITGAAWGEDIPENMAPPLKAFFAGSAD